MTVAYAVPNYRMFQSGFPLVGESSRGQSPEALKVSQKVDELAGDWLRAEGVRGVSVAAAAKPRLLPDSYKTDVIKEVLAQSVGYASLSYIAHEAQLDIADAARLLRTNPAFRKSLIRTTEGEDVYLLNTRFSCLSDAWKWFCYLNALKYS
jgi:hypothetical protein